MSKDEADTDVAKLTVGLIKIGSFVVSYCSTPEFTGLKGIFGAAMVAGGTGLLTGVAAFCGTFAGLAVGSLGGRDGAIIGAMLGGVGAALVATPGSYHLTEDMILNGYDKSKPVEQLTVNPLQTQEQVVPIAPLPPAPAQ